VIRVTKLMVVFFQLWLLKSASPVCPFFALVVGKNSTTVQRSVVKADNDRQTKVD